MAFQNICHYKQDEDLISFIKTSTLCLGINSPLVMDLHKLLDLLCEQTDAFDTERKKKKRHLAIVTMKQENIILTMLYLWISAV